MPPHHRAQRRGGAEPVAQGQSTVPQPAPLRIGRTTDETPHRVGVAQVHADRHPLPPDAAPGPRLPLDLDTLDRRQRRPFAGPRLRGGLVGEHLPLRRRLERDQHQRPRRRCAGCQGIRSAGHRIRCPLRGLGLQPRPRNRPRCSDIDHGAEPCRSHSIVATCDRRRVGFSIEVAAPTYGSIVCKSFCGVASTRWKPNSRKMSSAIRV